MKGSGSKNKTRLQAFYVRCSREKEGQFCVVRRSDQAEIFHSGNVDCVFRLRKRFADEAAAAVARAQSGRPPRPD